MNMFRLLFRIAALVGIGYAATKLSKKENRDRVASEYSKVKEDPKKYAQDVQEKVSESAQEYQEKARSEYYKAKDDPKAYSEDLQSKAKGELDKIKSTAEEKIQDIRKKDDTDEDNTEAQEARFDDETPAKTDVKDVEDADFENNVLRDYEETEEELLEKNKDDKKTVITKKDEK